MLRNEKVVGVPDGSRSGGLTTGRNVSELKEDVAGCDRCSPHIHPTEIGRRISHRLHPYNQRRTPTRGSGFANSWTAPRGIVWLPIDWKQTDRDVDDFIEAGVGNARDDER